MTDPTGSTSARSPLKSSTLMVQFIAGVTGRCPDDVRRALLAEYKAPGVIVVEEFRRRKLTPYSYCEGLERFYSESDAFVFESAVWNRNRIKRAMRQWIGRYLETLSAQRGGKGLEVLCVGDGLGFDSAYLAKRGHRVTYHELAGPHERFARALFEHSGLGVRIALNDDDLGDATFDVITCLDVLEHVPEPGGMLGSLLPRLRADGRLIVHAPFYMVHPAYPTHLKSNRVHAGSLQLYEQLGLGVVACRAMWNPLVLARVGDGISSLPLRCRLNMWGGALYQSLGRWTSLPFRPIHLFRRVHRRWFD